MKRICVFCSSHEGLADKYVESARQLGRLIGENGAGLVYGGSRCGLMEVVAQAVKQGGGRVIGVVPDIIRDRGLESPNVDVTFYTSDLNDRKSTMLRESDAAIALPGGIGTLDEVFSFLASGVIGYHNKPLFLLNVDGFWDGLGSFLSMMKEKGFVSPSAYRLLRTVSTTDELSSLLFADKSGNAR